MSKLVNVALLSRNCGKLDYLYSLYSSVARQQVTHLINAFPYSVLGQVVYLIALSPDLCILPYFKQTVAKKQNISNNLMVIQNFNTNQR